MKRGGFLQRRTPIRKKGNKSKKRHPTRGLKRRAWQAFARYIRHRDPHCVTCGSPTTEAGHFIANSERKADLGGNELWYDPRNVNGQCSRCNRWLSSNPIQYTIFMEEKYGFGIVQELRKLHRIARKWTPDEVENIVVQYSI